MTKSYIISDLHIGHKNILKYRTEFSSIAEHDGTILDNILSTLNKRDSLTILGDCFFDAESVESHLRVIKGRCARINWILGNHDTDSALRQKNVKYILEHGLVDKIHGLTSSKGYWLSHAPIHPAELRGKMNIHGHVHSKTIRDDNYINVSCENVRYTPVDVHELVDFEYREINLVQYGETYD